MEILAQLCHAAGVTPDYRDAWDRPQSSPAEVVRAVLGAMGLPAADDDQAAASLRALEERPWRRPLPPVLVLRSDSPIVLPLSIPAALGGVVLAWTLRTEDGGSRFGSVRIDSLPVEGTREIDGATVERRRFELPVTPPLGYHRVGLDGLGIAVEAALIVVPHAAYLPPAAEDGARLWGLAIQLYGLRSARNWGVGDFSDLAAFADAAGGLGASFVGLNPLHERFPTNPAHASPYAPSHRGFLDVLSIDPSAIEGYAGCAAAQPDEGRLAALRAAGLVDFPGVAAAKLPALEALYRAGLPRWSADPDFARFRAERGAALDRLCLFEALAERFRDRGGWPAWPPEFRDPESPAVRAFAAEAADRIGYHAWLQWQADRQLGAAAARARAAGMPVGLYRDLALGADGGGAETWACQAAYAKAVSTGAPPDDWNRLGQDWGLPPFDPLALREAAYAPFVATVRANMRHAGALRIDHVMSLMRLYWLPHGVRADAGCYVRYPFEDLLGIVALESVRARCMVIGEDLGTVPPEIRTALAEARVLSYRLAIFEMDGPSHYKPPEHYPRGAMVTISTHDLATLPAYWRSIDIDVRDRLGLFPDAAVAADVRSQRLRDRAGLVQALKQAGLLAPDHPDAPEEATPALVEALHAFLARTPAILFAVDLADLVGEVAQVNVPGTTDQHPNWRRKIDPPVEAVASHPVIAGMAAVIGRDRPRPRESG
ncbi:MAG: 4-alpha-glucanotransferase [Rhodospirillaceae bacterium]